MRNAGMVILLMAVVLGFSTPVVAREGNAGHHDRVGGSRNDQRGGAAVDHRSQKAIENSNAQWSIGATKGQDRANLRRQDGHDRGHGKDHDGQARGHSKDHSGKARGHDKRQPGQGRQDRDSN